jgi:hypothetical protein
MAQKGFEISFDPERRILKVRVWGDWDMQLAKKFGSILREKIAEICKSEKVWYGLADFTDFFPLSETVESLLKKHFDLAKKRGMKELLYISPQTDPNLQCDHDSSLCNESRRR